MRYIECNRKTNIYDIKMEGRTPRKIKINPDSIPDTELGWICDCGRWTNTDREYHKVY